MHIMTGSRILNKPTYMPVSYSNISQCILMHKTRDKMHLTNKLSPIILYFDAIFTFGTISMDINAKIITNE